MAEKLNPYAFPRPASELKNEYHKESAPAMPGMTLLDYFAGQALAGTLAGSTVYLDDAAVARAYSLAGKMLEERQKYLK
jgi:hypothetical protein